jgi:hypothetical protein
MAKKAGVSAIQRRKMGKITTDLKHTKGFLNNSTE